MSLDNFEEKWLIIPFFVLRDLTSSTKNQVNCQIIVRAQSSMWTVILSDGDLDDLGVITRSSMKVIYLILFDYENNYNFSKETCDQWILMLKTKDIST